MPAGNKNTSTSILRVMLIYLWPEPITDNLTSESESELFTGDTSKDNHSSGPVFREVSP